MVVIRKKATQNVGNYTTQIFEGETLSIGDSKITILKVNDERRKGAVRINVMAPKDKKISKDK